MKKLLVQFSLVIMVFFSTSCAETNPNGCIECRNWKVVLVRENGIVVYSENGSKIYPGYSKFKLNLIEKDKVAEYMDITGSEFKGNWSIDSDKTLLRFTNLAPLLFGTDSTLDFSIVSISESSLTLKNTKANLKTGGTINEYVLIPY